MKKFRQPQIYTYTYWSRKKLSDDAVEIILKPKAARLEFYPGQTVRVFLNLRIGTKPVEVTREFSITSSSDEEMLAFTYKAAANPFYAALDEMQRGDSVTVYGPLGVFTLPEDQETPCIFLAAGIGIAPFMSMLRQIKKDTPNREVELHYAYRDSTNIAFKQELIELAKELPKLRVHYLNARYSEQYILDHFQKNVDTYWYVSGDSEMITEILTLLTTVNVSETMIKTEEYVGGYGDELLDFSGVVPSHPKIMHFEHIHHAFLPTIDRVAALSVINAKGDFVYINSKFSEISQYSPDELLGQNGRILKSGAHDADIYVAVWQTMMAGNIWRGELKNRAKDGSYYWMDVTISPLNHQLKNQEQLFLVLGFLVTKEVEERQNLLGKVKLFEENEQANLNLLEDLEIEKEKFRNQALETKKFALAVDSTDDPIIITDPDGLVVYANRAVEKVTGYKIKEVMGLKAGEHWGGLMEESFYEKLWKKIIKDKNTFRGEIKNVRKNGREYISFATISPVLDEKNNVKYVIGIERDISEEKAIDKMKTEFISLASHQLKTPLGTIKWYIEAIKDDVGYKKVSPQIKKFLEVLYISNERVLDIVRDLLNVSKIETGKIDEPAGKVQLAKVIKKVLSEFSTEIKKRKLDVKSNIEKVKVPQLLINENRLHQTISNVVSNAVKYNKIGGSVLITITNHHKSVEIQVEDTGIGIPKHNQEKLFSKFYRGDNAISTNTDGSGLGLYVVKFYLESWGGNIAISSKEDRGTTVTITLPHEAT